MNSFYRKVVVVACISGLFVAGGCKNPKVRPGGEGETLGFDEIPFDDDERLGFDEENRVRVRFEHVHFGYDSFQVGGTEVRKIEAVADYARRNPKVSIIAEGHCDERGSREYNMSLGEHRALAVRAYLVGLGIEDSRIQTRSFGEECPVDPGHNESSWRLNRRVEFALYR
jgi:peptidoglycan-associated lipoprotein